MADGVVTIEFRDGEKYVPAHVALLLRGLATHTMTYDQAIRMANQNLLRRNLNQAQKDLISTHFRQHR